MPKRMIREGLIQSDSVNALTWQAEVFFVRLMLKADDFGRYTADLRLARAALFPLRLDQVREADVQRWIAECVKAGLIRLYVVDGKTYLEIPKFDQRMRAKKSRFPAPDGHMAVTCQSDVGHMLHEVEVEVEEEGAPPHGGHVAVIRPPGDRFEEFWAVYPVKAGKRDAEKAWKKLSDPERDLAIEKASLYAKAMAGHDAVKWAQGWLNGRRWEDDPAAWKLNGGKPGAQPTLELGHPSLMSDAERAYERERSERLRATGRPTETAKGAA